jgi:hypothetical protein
LASYRGLGIASWGDTQALPSIDATRPRSQSQPSGPSSAPLGHELTSPGLVQDFPSALGTKPGSHEQVSPPSQVAFSPQLSSSLSVSHTPAALHCSPQPQAGRHSVAQTPATHSSPSAQPGSQLPPLASARTIGRSPNELLPATSSTQTART